MRPWIAVPKAGRAGRAAWAVPKTMIMAPAMSHDHHAQGGDQHDHRRPRPAVAGSTYRCRGTAPGLPQPTTTHDTSTAAERTGWTRAWCKPGTVRPAPRNARKNQGRGRGEQHECGFSCLGAALRPAASRPPRVIAATAPRTNTPTAGLIQHVQAVRVGEKETRCTPPRSMQRPPPLSPVWRYLPGHSRSGPCG